MKIEQLTSAQIAALPKYTNLGIKMGLATDDINTIFPEAHVRELTDAHREMCGAPKATNFLIFDSPMAVKADPRCQGCAPSNALYGQHDSNWLVNYLFFRVECGLIEETAKIVHLLELAKLVGWMWMSSDTTIVTKRPMEIHMLAKATGPKVLHNPTGMALKYRDGNGLCVVHGVHIPVENWSLVMDRQMSQEARIKAILAIRNTEVRGALLMTLPADALVKSLKAKTIDTDTVSNGGFYELVEVDIENQQRRYLTGTCPSKKDSWFEAVPPTCATVRQALAWREWGKLEIPYVSPVVRT